MTSGRRRARGDGHGQRRGSGGRHTAGAQDRDPHRHARHSVVRRWLIDVAREPFNTEAYDKIDDNQWTEPGAQAAVDLLDRRRHRVLRERPPLPESGAAAAEGRGPHRGADQLLLVRLSAAARRHAVLGHDRRSPNAPWNPRHRLALVGLQASGIDAGEDSAAQSRVPDRRVGLDDVAEQAAAGQGVAGDARPNLTRAGSRRASSSTPAPPGWSCRPRAATTRRRSSRRSAGSRPADRPTARRASGSPTRRRATHFIKGGVNRVILATDGDFNVGVTNQGDLMRLIEENARQRRHAVGARLRHGQPQGLDDGEAGRQGQRQLRLHRHARRGAEGARRAGGRHARHRRQGREAAGRVQPEARRGLPADRLREPRARRIRISTTTARTPATWAPATR